MNKLAIFTVSAMVTMTSVAKELEITPGSFPAQLKAIESSGDATLVLKGEANILDLSAFKHLPKAVTNLDMSGLKISAYTLTTGDYYGKSEFAADALPDYVLLGTGVKTVVLPADLTEIGAGAFSGSALESISLKGIKSLGENVFYGCTSLKSVDFSGAEFAEIPAGAFGGCSSLSELSLPATIYKIGDRSFKSSGVVNADLKYLLTVGDYAFADDSKLESVTLSYGCMLGEGCFFSNSSLTSVDGVPGNLPDLFVGNSPVSSISANIATASVGEGAFAGSELEKLLFTSAVQEIGHYAFANMQKLASVDVTALDKTVPETDAEAFAGVDVSQVKLKVLTGSEDVWKSAAVWQDFNIEEGLSNNTDIDTFVNEIEVGRNENVIFVKSGEILTEVSLYSIDGSLLATYNPGQETFTLTMPDKNEVVIVKAVGGKEIKIVKFMK